MICVLFVDLDVSTSHPNYGQQEEDGCCTVHGNQRLSAREMWGMPFMLTQIQVQMLVNFLISFLVTYTLKFTVTKYKATTNLRSNAAI